MKSLDEKILNLIQYNFPITSDPYGDIAGELDCSREEIHQAVQSLRSQKIIRRIGGSFNARKLGYVSTLIAAQVEKDDLMAVAEVASSFPEVTHNYERSGIFNLWFTIIAGSSERVQEIVDQVGKQPGVQKIHNLPASKVYKLKVNFSFKNDQ